MKVIAREMAAALRGRRIHATIETQDIDPDANRMAFDFGDGEGMLTVTTRGYRMILRTINTERG